MKPAGKILTLLKLFHLVRLDIDDQNLIASMVEVEPFFLKKQPFLVKT
jgi:hypothetical protein